jgi:hypothetical protein
MPAIADLGAEAVMIEWPDSGHNSRQFRFPVRDQSEFFAGLDRTDLCPPLIRAVATRHHVGCGEFTVSACFPPPGEGADLVLDRFGAQG